MGGNFRSGRAGACGIPQAQINLCFISRYRASRQCEALFLRQMRLRGKSQLVHFQAVKARVCSQKKRSAKAQKASRKSTDGLLFLLSVFAARTGFLSASQWAQKNGRVLCACARFAASSPLRRIFYRTARTTVSDCRRRRVLRTLQALHVGRRLVWSELRRGFSRTSRP